MPIPESELRVNGVDYSVRSIGIEIYEVIRARDGRRVGFFIAPGASDAQLHPQGVDLDSFREIVRIANTSLRKSR